MQRDVLNRSCVRREPRDLIYFRVFQLAGDY